MCTVSWSFYPIYKHVLEKTKCAHEKIMNKNAPSNFSKYF